MVKTAPSSALVTTAVPNNDDVQAENFRFYTRYVKWSGGQLEDECASGIWFPASAERRVILSPEASTGREYWHQVGNYRHRHRHVCVIIMLMTIIALTLRPDACVQPP